MDRVVPTVAQEWSTWLWDRVAAGESPAVGTDRSLDVAQVLEHLALISGRLLVEIQPSRLPNRRRHPMHGPHSTASKAVLQRPITHLDEEIQRDPDLAHSRPTAAADTEVGHVFRKSSYSPDTGDNCVEVATTHDQVLVQDTQENPRRTRLAFSHAEWTRFVAGLKS